MKMDIIKILRRLNKEYLRFLAFKKVEIIEEMMCEHTQLQFLMPIQSGRSF